jgi:SRSO17 transposase
VHELVRVAHLRWRIERDYQDLKQDLGLVHYEGRGWWGFHHHASLSIAAYGYLVAQRLKQEQSPRNGQGEEKFFSNAKCLRFPQITSPVAASQRAQRHMPNSITTLRLQLSSYLLIEIAVCPFCGSCNRPLRL